MAQSVGSYTNPLKKFKLVFLGEQSGMIVVGTLGYSLVLQKQQLAKTTKVKTHQNQR